MEKVLELVSPSSNSDAHISTETNPCGGGTNDSNPIQSCMSKLNSLNEKMDKLTEKLQPGGKIYQK
jgi:hypothetical protein